MARLPRRRRRLQAREGRVDVARVVEDKLRALVPEEVRVLLQVREVWPRIAPGRLQTRTWPAAVSGGELVVHVHDNQWLHELNYLRKELEDNLRAACPRLGIERIRLRLGSVERPVPASEAPPRPATPRARMTEEPDRGTLEALETVRDPELKQLMARTRVMLGRPPERTS